jgi:hypothetical protein
MLERNWGKGVCGTVNISKQWTSFIDPVLPIREIERDIDPILGAHRVEEKLQQFQPLKPANIGKCFGDC